MSEQSDAPKPAPRLSLRGVRSALAGPFDLELPAGTCLAISGASGAGKSLLLRMIADLDPNTGEVRLDGVLREAMSGPAWRRKACYVAAESGWWRETPCEHFAPEHRDAGRAVAKKLGVREGAFDEEVRRLSTGERQRLALVRALVLDPPILLLDEPTGPLDPESAGRVETVLAERLAAGTTIMLVSHDPSQAKRMGADRRLMRNRRLETLS